MHNLKTSQNSPIVVSIKISRGNVEIILLKTTRFHNLPLVVLSKTNCRKIIIVDLIQSTTKIISRTNVRSIFSKLRL